MGFNTWDRFACKGIDAEVMMQSADLMVSTGLKEAGYLYVNLDGCWQAPDRLNGRQHPDPVKFPQGLAPVVAHIHSLGLKAGIYTALANHTCGSGPGACLNEAVDAKQYADWQFDYVKDDACGDCRPGQNGTLEDYAAMQAGIVATGRPMILSIEAQPDVRTVSAGGHGNLRRVGHDINPTWRSMSSLIDMDSGLHPFAHNASVSPTGNGYYNDLDIMEIGNGIFAPLNDSWPPGAVDFARAHFSMWSILKGALLLGNDFTKMSNATLSIVTNHHVIGINQDPLGVQARRVAVTAPPATDSTSPICAAEGTTVAGSDVPCDNVVSAAKCNATNRLQKWSFNETADGRIFTVDSVGTHWCLFADHSSLADGSLVIPWVEEGAVRAVPCAALAGRKGATWTVRGSGNAVRIQDADFRVLLGANNEFGSSGPIPHSRHTCCECSGTPVVSWSLGKHGEITLPRGSQVIDDDSIGSVEISDGSKFCLTIVESGRLEVWTAPLAGGRHAVALFNRCVALSVALCLNSHQSLIQTDWPSLPTAHLTPQPSRRIGLHSDSLWLRDILS
eukprot:COSAG02_NODE_134_length_34593_cov_43.594886_8_plen_561_part_00